MVNSALDTNCLVRWLLWDVEEQAMLVDNMLSRSPSQFYIADLAIVEMVWVLKSVYEFDDGMLKELLIKVIEHKSISCNKRLFYAVFEDMGGTPKVSFTDLCLVHYARLTDANKLYTFDKTLARRFEHAELLQ